ncbi:MAG: hypothetical protein L6R00_06865 [Phycisphaerae bacterium]|nr:hypothetical protein [Phycisphaerae bacterium]
MFHFAWRRPAARAEPNPKRHRRDHSELRSVSKRDPQAGRGANVRFSHVRAKPGGAPGAQSKIETLRRGLGGRIPLADASRLGLADALTLRGPDS